MTCKHGRTVGTGCETCTLEVDLNAAKQAVADEYKMRIDAEAERDAARAAAATNEKRANGWRADFNDQAGALQATRGALEDIAWHGLNGLGCIERARRVLAALDSGTPGEGTPKLTCGECGWSGVLADTVEKMTVDLCPKCENVVLSGDARVRARIAATPAAPMCKPWCGVESQAAGEDRPCDRECFRPARGKYQDTCFCTPACRDAGRSLHPTSPTPTEEPPR
jgi:hypothetical protein